MQVMDEDPAGQTPLCEHVQDVVQTIQSIEDSLREKGQRAIVIIATDGLATDGNVAAALEPLKRLPVIVILRLCTNDEPVVKYWNEIDTELELEVRVQCVTAIYLFDYCVLRSSFVPSDGCARRSRGGRKTSYTQESLAHI
jgi:hypothetical protein